MEKSEIRVKENIFFDSTTSTSEGLKFR